MTTKKLTIKDITFPKFANDDSKKNFRLVFHIGYTDNNGNDAVATVSKPDTGHWQWKNPNKDAFLTPKIVGDSVQLDTLILRNGDGKKIPQFSNKIVELDGSVITDFSVQFLDVADNNFSSIFVKNILPDLIAAWKVSGIDPIDMVPIPGGIKTIIKSKVDLQTLVDSSESFFTKKVGDKD